MITREKLKSYIDHFPNELSIDEVIERLIFIEKIEARLQESQNGDVVTEDDLAKDIETWL